MRAPSTLALLEAWESATGLDFARCGLALLAAACPEVEADTLAALSIGERDRRLLSLREVVFGPRMMALASCAQCAEAMEFELSAGALQALAPAEPDAALVVEHGGWRLDLRAPDSRDLIAAADAPECAGQVLFTRSVRAAAFDGAPANAGTAPPEVRAAAGERLALADPLADLQLALSCPGCGFRWSAPLDVVAFLWTELDAWAARTMRDVHVLACAYGWDERQILALPAARRDRYLRLAGA